MSVSLSPSASLGFNRPLTELIKRTLTITNQNAQPVAFKVKTTAPKLYCVRPNAGRIEPGESVGVTVQLQPMKEEPPPHVKCRDKFLVQSTTITAEKESMSLPDIWSPAEGESEVKVHQQKIKVVYLPPEGQTLEEEPEELAANPGLHTFVSEESRHYETVRQQSPNVNGHAPTFSLSTFDQPPPFPMSTYEKSSPFTIPTLEQSARRTPPPEPPASPHVDDSFVVAREEQSHIEERHENHVSSSPSPEFRQPSPMPIVNVNVHAPPAPQLSSAVDRSFQSSANASSPGFNAQDSDLATELAEAQSEIQRLRALLAATPDPAEIRRRTRVLSEEDTLASEGDVVSDAGTSYPEQQTSSRQDGASPQQVGIIALMVFIITYLFF